MRYSDIFEKYLTGDSARTKALKQKAGGNTGQYERKYNCPFDLGKDILAYLRWAEETFWIDHKAHMGKNGIDYSETKKHRMFTIEGFLMFANLYKNSFQLMEKNESYKGVIEMFRMIVLDQKATGGAAGVFNAMIVNSSLSHVQEKEERPTEITIRVLEGVSEDGTGADETSD